MHELSLIESILASLDELAAAHGLQTITAVTLRIGRLRQVAPEAMELAFALATKGTVADGARLSIEFVPIVIRCRICGVESTIEDNVFVCPACLGPAVEVVKGMELIIQSIEGEKP